MKKSNTEKKVPNGTNEERNQDLLPLSFAGDNETEPGSSGTATRSADMSTPDRVLENSTDSTSAPLVDNALASLKIKTHKRKTETVTGVKHSQMTEPEKPENTRYCGKPQSNS